MIQSNLWSTHVPGTTCCPFFLAGIPFLSSIETAFSGQLSSSCLYEACLDYRPRTRYELPSFFTPHNQLQNVLARVLTLQFHFFNQKVNKVWVTIRCHHFRVPHHLLPILRWEAEMYTVTGSDRASWIGSLERAWVKKATYRNGPLANCYTVMASKASFSMA